MKTLLEYEVTSFTMTPVDDPLKSGQRVSLKLKNSLSGPGDGVANIPAGLGCPFSQTSRLIPQDGLPLNSSTCGSGLPHRRRVRHRPRPRHRGEHETQGRTKVFPSNVTVISVTTASGDKFPRRDEEETRRGKQSRSINQHPGKGFTTLSHHALHPIRHRSLRRLQVKGL
ncbi:hypothetical protein Hamer_G026284 [Homarus americanus]|uniref:Uncharacterized protein n=1 Tax=Homarus americanus TaxID=6706 RepID=A0A8J5MTG3_HOMAM|nr:hypothetical protein Hamer_G026284 [Homarus americanus]